MMKTTQNKSSGVIQRALSVVVGLALLAVMLPGMALANSGAGAVILNVATVAYQDATATTNFSATSSASVTILLVASAPTLSAPADDPTTPSGTAATYSYTVTSTANGSEIYDVASAITGSNNLASSSATPSVATVTLGASVIIAHTAGSADITIPAGSGANLANGDTVVIDSVAYTINNITAGITPSHTNSGAATSTAGTTTSETSIVITLNSTIAASKDTFQVGESTTFTVDVIGTNSSSTDGDATASTTVTSQTAPNPVATDVTLSTYQAVGYVEILKEVRNVTTAGAFAATANGVPGNTLEYRIVMTNTGATNATSVTLTDPLPDYTAYVADSTRLNGATVVADGGISPMVAGLVMDDDQARVDDAATDGIIDPVATAPNNKATVIFQVIIN